MIDIRLHPHHKIGDLQILEDLDDQIGYVADFVVAEEGVGEIDEPFLDAC